MKRYILPLVLVGLLFLLAGVLWADSIPSATTAVVNPPTPPASPGWLEVVWDAIKSFATGGPWALIATLVTVVLGFLKFAIWGPKIAGYGNALTSIVTLFGDFAAAGKDGKIDPEEAQKLYKDIAAIVTAFKPGTDEAGRRATVAKLEETIRPTIPSVRRSLRIP